MSFLAIDIGNTEIVFGVLEEDRIRFSCRLGTDGAKSSDEYAVLFRNLLELYGVDPLELEGGILSSVVPSLKTTVQEAVQCITGKRCLVVGPGLKNGLKIRIDDPAQLGSDCVAVAVATAAEYPLPALIFDMGTATTVSVLSQRGEYLGGMLLPGVTVSLEALVAQASQLSHISLTEVPAHPIGTNSNDCLVNGVIRGNAAMIDGLIKELSEELEGEPTVLATGGLSEQILPYCRKKILSDPDLLLKGLRIIYIKNRKKKEDHGNDKKEKA